MHPIYCIAGDIPRPLAFHATDKTGYLPLRRLGMLECYERLRCFRGQSRRSDSAPTRRPLMRKFHPRPHAIWFVVLAAAGCASQPYHEDPLLGDVLLGTGTKLERTGTATSVAGGNWRQRDSR